MFGKIFLIVVMTVVGLSCGVAAQGQDAAALAAGLDKSKHKVKEKTKHGVTVKVEIYIDIKNVPEVRQPAAYSGRYGDDDGGCRLDLKVAANGDAEGSGADSTWAEGRGNDLRSYTLRNGRVNGAVLTGEKVYADGSTERLEAVFVNRTTLNGKSPTEIETRETQFGLGWVQSGKDWTNRVFLPAK